MSLDVPVGDLIRWSDTTAQRWRDLLNAHPELLTVPTSVRNSGTLDKLMQHIVAVELRYAQRLAMEPESSYDEVPFGSGDALFATHRRAFDKLATLLERSNYDWSQEIDFQTISAGRIRSTRRDVLLHTVFHSIRHYAQLATLVREHGVKPWPMDFLWLNGRRPED